MARVLGRYHIISELGRGGMGVVYKALDPKLERFIAIKCLSDELSSDEIVVARFLREARNVAALNHPNIAQIYVADEHEGMPYFVMEYVDGESLADFIAREGQCSPEMARRVAEQSAEALAAAAEENIVHRDIKPGNIMLDRRGRAVLTDFGIACVAADPHDGGRSATMMGTPGYLPPEALTGSKPDCRGDIFALGLVYFEMLAGRRMVTETDLKATLAQYMTADFPDLSCLQGQVDKRVIDILSRMLAVKPEARYPDCQSLLEDMAPLKTGQTGPVARSDSGPSTAETVAADIAGGTAADKTREASGTAATEALSTGSGPSPETVPVARENGSGRGRRFAVAGVIVASLAMIVLGVARLDDAQWERVSGVFTDREDAVAEVAGDMDQPTLVAQDETPVDSGALDGSVEGDDKADGVEHDPVLAGKAQVNDEITEQDALHSDEAMATDRAIPEVVEPGSTVQPAVEAAQADPASVTAPEAAAAGEVAQAPATEIDSIAPQQPEPKPEPPTGVAVIGVGDPVIADPMAREIEQALHGGRSPLVDKRFIGNYRQFIYGEEVDLAGLSESAIEAGVRYVVVARALPAGTRELQFYNRYETAWIVQLEVQTFDLHLGRELGSSPLEQVEYTSLNASERARESVRPWLPGIRDQFN